MKKEIQIHGKYEEDLWPAEVDRGQIQQTLLNLYLNAWQAMPGGGNIFLQTANVILDESDVKSFAIAPGRYIRISVTDTGVGMDEATRNQIFEPFFSKRGSGQGTGLGLASVYGIVKNHGGFINVYSEKGKGSTFNIYLPAIEKKIIDENPELDRRKIQYGQGTILLVDDEDMVIDAGQKMLESIGYNVLIAQSGSEALDVYIKQKDEIDLIILDMIMPEMSGGETYERMRNINAGVNVLLSSGYSINSQVKEILNRGCNGFIQKPFSLKELSIKVRELLEETKKD
jgi:CheY-like chemotaxis protein